jgi:hypothetical protein
VSGGPQPSELAALAGTERMAEGAWQVDGEELTGCSTVTMWARARVDQDQVRQLPTGEADLIVRALVERVRIIPPSVRTVARGLTAPLGIRSAPSASSSAPAKQRAGCFGA